jgi:hypothetical protein
MGTTQGNSLCSCLYLKLAKHHISHFIFYIVSSTKSENRREDQVLSRGECWHEWDLEGDGEKG